MYFETYGHTISSTSYGQTSGINDNGNLIKAPILEELCFRVSAGDILRTLSYMSMRVRCLAMVQQQLDIIPCGPKFMGGFRDFSVSRTSGQVLLWEGDRCSIDRKRLGKVRLTLVAPHFLMVTSSLWIPQKRNSKSRHTRLQGKQAADSENQDTKQGVEIYHLVAYDGVFSCIRCTPSMIQHSQKHV